MRRTSFKLIALLCIQQIFLVINDLLTYENSLDGHSLGVHSTLIFSPYRQLLNAHAEEAAVHEAIYYLGEAMKQEVIDCDVFLKQVRKMARRQFFLKATMNKCRKVAGLPV